LIADPTGTWVWTIDQLYAEPSNEINAWQLAASRNY
jgi:hypothetical protein